MAKAGARYKYVDPAAIAKLGRFNLVAKTVVEGMISGLHRSPYHGFSVEFAEHRKYVPGDPIRDVDWKALAKTDRYYVKLYEEETNLKAFILIDTSASMSYRSSEEALSKLDYACYLGASLAYLMVRQADSVGLVTFDQDIDLFMPAGSTPSHLNAMLEKLEEVKPGKRTDMASTFHNLAEHIKRRGLIIVISDLFDDPKEVMRGLSHFRQKRHEVLVFHVFDKAELDFPFRALADFVDMETNERIQVDPKYVREEYVRLVNEFVDQYRKDCSEMKIEYVATHTGVPYDTMLTEYLGKRAKVR